MDFIRTINEATPLLMQGIKLTVLISLLSIVIGSVIGFFALHYGYV